MSNRSQIILTNKNELSYEGERAQGDGYYGFNDGLHTVSFHMNNFTGRIYLEATLMENPEPSDWFLIEMQTSHPYLQYSNHTGAIGISFTGNFVWLRASVDRTHLAQPAYDVQQHGVLDKAVLLI